MSTWFLAAALVIALAGAVGVLVFESPTRSAGGLLTALVGTAAAAAAIGAPLVPGYVLWVGGGGIGLLLLGAVLLLNIGEEERGKRRLRIRPALSAPVLALLIASLAGPLVDLAPATPVVPVTDEAIALGMIDDLALPFTVGLVALAAALVVAIAVVRRRT